MNTSAIATSTERNRLPRMTLPFQRLCWKETLQIAPLALLLTAINGGLHLFPIGINDADQTGFHFLLIQLMPCLFASGLGALLISLEKEQRTIGWLSSLPIAPSQILRSKLLIGLAGLALFWVACLLIALVAERGLPREWFSPKEAGNSLPLAVLNSIFLALLGIATAWRWQSPLVALVMIVPLATAAQMTILAIQALSPEIRLPDYLIGIFYVLFSGVAWWYGWRSGQAYLASKRPGLMWQEKLKRFERTGSRGNLLSANPQGVVPTLVWQFTIQNRMILIAIIAMFLLPAIVLMIRAAAEDASVVAIPTWLVVSWLGASVFQSDSVHQRVRFLAERGVAPRTVWWTRQFVPLGLISIGTVVAAILIWALPSNNPQYSGNQGYKSYPLMLIGVPAGLLAHATAQWLGQLIRSPIVSLLLAPAVTLGVGAYLVFAIFVTGAPYWIVLCPIVIAFIATRVMTQPWMDGRMGWKYWLSHGAFLLVAALIPALPLQLTLLTYPGMPSGEMRKILAHARNHPIMTDPAEVVLPARQPSNLESQDLVAMQMMPGMDEAGSTDGGEAGTADAAAAIENQGLDGGELATGAAKGSEEGLADQQPALGFVEQIQQNVANIDAQLASLPGSIRWSPAIGFLSAEAFLTRAQLDLAPANELSKERFQAAVRALTRAVKRLRMSWRLVDQAFADRLEVWMYQQVKSKDGRALLGEANWSEVTAILADKAGRMAARKTAIVQSYFSSYNQELGGMTMRLSSGLPGWRGLIANNRRLARVSWLLLEYLESKDESEANQRFAEVASLWGYPTNRLSQVGLGIEQWPQVPGRAWFGEWENYRPEP
ncbi:MAG: hypothetical protein SFV81_01215 [Pirellulaceae bacterium]|nr:hypothetical protein [Pirellulaceae bacterium]